MPAPDKNYYLEIEDFEKPQKPIKKNENSSSFFPFQNKKSQNNSNQSNYNRQDTTISQKKLKRLKWIFIILILIILYFTYSYIISFFLDILKQNPTFYKYYLFLESNIVNKTLIGLLILAMLGALFFLALPSEAIFIFFLSSTQYFPPLIIAIIVFGNVIGLIFNYIFGWILGERILRWMFKKNFENYKGKVERYGGIIIFFGNILPGPVEVLSVFYGGFKFNFKRYIFLSFMGRLIKYVLLFIAYFYFWDQIIMYYDNFINFFV